MTTAAQHIMVYYYGTDKVFAQTDFAGTIVAPNTEVVVGQAGKKILWHNLCQEHRGPPIHEGHMGSVHTDTREFCCSKDK